jgi:hypothetical protein
MPDEKKAKKPQPGLGDEHAAGVVAAKNPGDAAYRREKVAMGATPRTPEQDAKGKRWGSAPRGSTASRKPRDCA